MRGRDLAFYCSCWSVIDCEFFFLVIQGESEVKLRVVECTETAAAPRLSGREETAEIIRPR